MKESNIGWIGIKEKDPGLGEINHHPGGMTEEGLQEHPHQLESDQGQGVLDISIGAGMQIYQGI